MNILKIALPTLLLSLLTGCWLGDYVPENEITTVASTPAGLCFNVPDAGDYRPYYLSIKQTDIT
ncbi:hypothetical protein ACGVWS_12575 [Enterobacteriaceae bacterium LUAb1]